MNETPATLGTQDTGWRPPPPKKNKKKKTTKKKTQTNIKTHTHTHTQSQKHDTTQKTKVMSNTIPTKACGEQNKW